jgi:hypothetical protein
LTFYFHLDFENLSKRELALLVYAVRPTSAFRHKLGFGKALGLGTVRIEPLAMFRVDRQARYRQDDLFDKPRFCECHLLTRFAAGEWQQIRAELPRDRYGREASRLDRARLDDLRLLDELLPSIRSEAYGDRQRQALEQIGDPAGVVAPVHYPQVWGPREGEASFEGKRYTWFVANDNQDEEHRQFLAALPTADGKLPTLER